MSNRICPGCGRHCYLDEAKCERGAEYAKTGVMPPRKPRPDGAPGGHHHHSEQMMMYRALDQSGKLAFCIKDMAGTIGENQESAYEEMFACLREEDRADLLLMLEKIRSSWRRSFGEKSAAQAPAKE